MIKRKLLKRSRRGDTLIEVSFALAIFGLVSAGAISIMNSGVEVLQSTLELTMAKNEIDAQAEALRFIHNSYLSERELANTTTTSDGVRINEYKREYQELWLKLSRGTTDTVSSSAGQGLSNDPASISTFDAANACDTYYDQSNSSQPAHNLWQDHAFVINTRNVSPTDISSTVISADEDKSSSDHIFKNTALYPRLIFTSSAGGNNEETLVEHSVYDKVKYAEGIWVIGTREKAGGPKINNDDDPQFYDFHIRACWVSPGRETPTTISTIIRLYNPEYFEETV